MQCNIQDMGMAKQESRNTWGRALGAWADSVRYRVARTLVPPWKIGPQVLGMPFLLRVASRLGRRLG